MAKNKYICKCCGKEYFSYKEKSNYCSRECRTKDNIFFHKCEFCGKEIQTNKSIHMKYIIGEKKHLYCSKECADKAHTKKVKKICIGCGKEYLISNAFSDVQKYCSRKCYEYQRSKMTKLQEKTCPICNNIFYTYHSTQVYCSKECRGKSIQNRIICKCKVCGKEFERIKSEVVKNEHHYCSKECKYEGIRWNVHDIKILCDNYRKIKTLEIQKMLSKEYSIKAIRSRAKDFGFAQSRLWSKEEEQIILDNYENISLNEMLKLLPNRTIPSIMHKARQFNLLSNFYKNNKYSVDEIKFLKDNYLGMSNYELSQKLSRPENGIAQKLWHLELYRPFEIQKTGYKNLISFMRSRLAIWKDEVREKYKYTCCLSGKHSNIIVHHCRSFNLIFAETIDILNFPEYDSFEDYSDDELILFSKTFLDLQEYYNAYVCITEDIHKLFHREYGYGDNTEEQWEEFVYKYRNRHYKNIA